MDAASRSRTRLPLWSGAASAFVVLMLAGLLLISLSEKAWQQQRRADASRLAGQEATLLQSRLSQLAMALQLLPEQPDEATRRTQALALQRQLPWANGLLITYQPALPFEAPPAPGELSVTVQEQDAVRLVHLQRELAGAGEGAPPGGWLQLTLPLPELLRSTGLGGLKPQGFDYRLRSKELAAPRLLVESRRQLAAERVSQQVLLPGNALWELEVAPDPDRGHGPWYPWLVGLAFAIALVFSVSGLLLAQLPERLRRLVSARTRELAERTAELESQALKLQAESEKREATSQELVKLSWVVKQSSNIVMITDPEGCIEYVNPAFTLATGYEADEVTGQTPRILKSGVQDGAFYRRLWSDLKSGRNWHGEICNRRKDGGLYWEQTSISPIRNRNGTIVHFAAVKQDVTQRKEQELRRREAQAVFEAVTEAIVVTDAQAVIKSVNPAFTRITGYTSADAVGRTPAMLHSGRQSPAFYDEMKRSLDRHGQWSGEVWNRRKNGDVYPQWLSIAAIRDDQGQTREFVGLFSDISERKAHEEAMRFQANYDALTRLPNRMLFEDRLRSAIKVARRRNRRLALMFIDLDRFKWVNDNLGHHAGDQLLIELSRRLRSCVRDTDTLARLAGDEFTLLLTDLNEQADAERVVQAVVAAVAAPVQLGKAEAQVSASVGISLYPDDGQEWQDLIRHADLAMYRAKSQGRNGYCFFTPEMNEKMHKRQALEVELRDAVRQGQFELLYQPLVALERDTCLGVEALLRWRHPQRGLLSPARFMEAAERMGLMSEVGDWVLEEVSACLRRWETQSWAPPLISVNFSLPQCQGDKGGNLLARLLEKRLFASGRLMIEINEAVVMAEQSQVRPLLHQLREQGVGVAVDDFGTGYSPLGFLKGQPVDYLKLDTSLVSGLGSQATQSGCRAMIGALINLAHSLGVRVIAEGVEMEEQDRLLRAMGCDGGQGYYYSEPLSLEDLERHLRGRVPVPCLEAE